MNPRSKKEYTDAIPLRCKNASATRNPLSWMSSALPALSTENTPSESLKDSSGFPNQRQKGAEDLPSTKTMKIFSNPLRHFSTTSSPFLLTFIPVRIKKNKNY